VLGDLYLGIRHYALSHSICSVSIVHCSFPYLCYNFSVQTNQVRNHIRAHIVVRGIVQGVNYRWYTQRRASDLHLTGYVCNLPDGSVQAIVEGTRSDIEVLLDALRVGPSAAVVESVQIEWHAPSGEFDRFEVRS
jgi:acylphosphatase